MRRAGRPRDVEAVRGSHLHEFSEGADLLRELFAIADHVVGGVQERQGVLLLLLALEQPVDAVEGDAAVVADDAAATVGVGKAGDDPGAAGRHDVRRVGVEDPVVVSLAVLGEDLGDCRVGLVAIRLQAGLDHAVAAVGHDGALERCVCLQSDNQLVGLVDVPRRVAGDRRRCVHVDVEDAALTLDDHEVAELLPDPQRALCGAGQEGRVAGVGLIVGLDEVADVDGEPPLGAYEATPGVGAGVGVSARSSGVGHDCPSRVGSGVQGGNPS